jgi:hypothetical protein
VQRATPLVGPAQVTWALTLTYLAVSAACRLWITPFTSFFGTITGIRAGFPLFGSVLIGGLAVLLIHLSLYPWPTRCYVGDQQTKRSLAAAASAQKAFDIVKPQLARDDACFKP